MPRHEQSTARVGPVSTAAFEGWYWKMYVPMKVLGIQIRIITTDFLSFCVLMHCYKLPTRVWLPTPKDQCGLTDKRGMQGISVCAYVP